MKTNQNPCFEFDETKCRANLAKHGIDFVEAQRLWQDENMIEIPARRTDESRHVVIGTIAGQNWSAIITYRGLLVRLISVRRARAEEIAIYES